MIYKDFYSDFNFFKPLNFTIKAVKYHVIAKVDPRNLSQPKKYFASIKRTDTDDLYSMVDANSDHSTVNPPDVIAVLESLIHIVPQMLTRGEIVRLGELGSFYLRLKSNGFNLSEEVSSKGIVRASMRFRAGSLIKNTIRNAAFRKYNPNID